MTCSEGGATLRSFDANGKPRALPCHNIPMAMLGTFILLFGWIGFNAASTFAATDVQFATIAANTAIAGAFGGVVAMFYMTRRAGKPDPGMMANGMIFSNGSYGAGWNLTTDVEGGVTGFLYGGSGVEQFLSQLIGVVTLWVVMGGLSHAFFFTQNKLTRGGIRSAEEDEIEGLDMPEMGVHAYNNSDNVSYTSSSTSTGSRETSSL